jgi:hypothetical protein
MTLLYWFSCLSETVLQNNEIINDSRFADRDLNPRPPEYKTGVNHNPVQNDREHRLPTQIQGLLIKIRFFKYDFPAIPDGQFYIIYRISCRRHKLTNNVII